MSGYSSDVAFTPSVKAVQARKGSRRAAAEPDMNSTIWGLVSALGWGSADFIARFTGRKLGPDVSLLGMLLVGVTTLTGAVLAIGLPPPGTTLGWALVIASGAAVLVGTLLLYDGLARGPVTIVAPIVGAYPVLNVAISFARGARQDRRCVKRRFRDASNNGKEDHHEQNEPCRSLRNAILNWPPF